MVKRHKQGFTQARSRLTSHRLRSATVGTHVPRGAGRHMNAEAVGFSSPRKQRRAARGVVDTILPNTESGESSSQYARRVSRREFAQGIQRRARVRRIVVVSLICIAAACAAVGVGVAAFFGSLDAKTALKDSNAASALVAPKNNEAFYTLVAADLDKPGMPDAIDGPDALALVRVDEAQQSLTVISLPPSLPAMLKDGKSHPLSEAADQGGDSALISAVGEFAGVDVSHYVKLDAAGVVKLVDALGGVDVDVTEEVDDPKAGDSYLPAGEQTLDGEKALTFLRASNFTKGVETQAANQREFLIALSHKLLGKKPFDFYNVLDQTGGSFQTDVSATDALGIAKAMRGIDPGSVKGALVPGGERTRNGKTYYAASESEWKKMMELVKQGSDPVSAPAPVNVAPDSFTLTVRNGAAVTGAAAQITDSLKSRGFKVEETGNTDTPAYKETLVVYNDDAYKDAAQSVVNALGLGRTVAGAGAYTFKTDVLVVVGKDWKPSS